MENNSGIESSMNTKNMKSTNKSTSKETSKRSHPSTAIMVHAAISTLNDRQGSSIPSITKYIETNYQVNIMKLKIYLKRYMKNAVAQGLLVQTKGHGFTGSFKLPPKTKKRTNKKTTNQKSAKEKLVEVSLKLPKVDNAAKELEKASKKSTIKSVVKTKAKAAKSRTIGQSQNNIQVSKETTRTKKYISSTPENPKSPSKTKKIKSPVVKKTPRPKRMVGTKFTN